MAYKFNPFTGNLDEVGAGSATTPGGSNTQIQFNDAGSFGGDVDLTWNKTTNVMTLKGDLTLDDNVAGSVTTLQTITPTQNNTISLPNATGTVALVAGSSGQLLWNNAGAYAGISGSSVTAGGNVTFNQVLVPNGTTTNPGFAFSANTDCGFYIRSTNQVGTVVDGSLKHETSANELTLFDFPIAFAPNTASPSDLVIRRDAANTLAQRNGTTAQTFRVYNTYTSSTNYELGKLEWTSNAFRIGTEKGSGGGTARALELQTDGLTKLTIGTGSTIESSGSVSIWSGGDFRAAASGSFYWNGRTNITSPANGDVLIGNLAQTDFGRMMFGGTTSSFPALKRSSATLQARLADDSGYTTIDAQLRAQGTAPATASSTGTAGDIRYDADYIYVCTATNTWKRAALTTW